ncbi:DNA double-strand break repair Rad50 ATPase [uncultured archaeon]|nr:DNA double-strand break repair Rad50 ATPase [uncultured archaeon]
MIKSISLENWKTHYRSEFAFEKGTNVIVGVMGSGKSSIMDAISFALYGTFPAQAARKVSLEETIMDRPVKQEQAKVRVEFDYRGKEYSVERVVKRSGSNEAYLREAGKILAGPKPTEVNSKVESLLEASYDLFSRAIYSEQNQMDYFLRLSPGQRKEKFDELLGLDRYEKVRQNAATLANRLKKSTEDRKAFLAEQKKKSDPDLIVEYRKRIEEKKKEAEEKAKEIGKSHKALCENESEVKKLEAIEKEHNSLNDALIRARSMSETLKTQASNASKRAEGIKGKDAAELLGAAEKAIETSAAEMKRLSKEKEKAEKKAAELREKRAGMRNALETHEKGIRNAKALGAECPVCKRPLAEHDKAKLEKELSAEKEKAKAWLAEIEYSIKSAEDEISGLKKKTEIAEEKTEAARKEAESMRRASEAQKDIESAEKEIKKLEAEACRAAEKISSLGFDNAKLRESRKKMIETSSRLAGLRAEEKAEKEILKELEEGSNRAIALQEQIKNLEESILAGEKSAGKMAVFGSSLRATQAELRNAMIGAINEAMAEIWQKIYPYDDITGVKISVEEGSYEVMARQRSGEWARVEGILSGGERSSAALAMRIAVSLVLTQNLGWIILDEPTHNLDANAVSSLSEVMRTHLPELIDQIFIITHDKEMENAASGKLYTLEREKGNDGVTRITTAEQ